jgi:hypothetical protein
MESDHILNVEPPTVMALFPKEGAKDDHHGPLKTIVPPRVKSSWYPMMPKCALERNNLHGRSVRTTSNMLATRHAMLSSRPMRERIVRVFRDTIANPLRGRSVS